MLLRARYVLPVDGPPIKNGAVRVSGDCIAQVGRARDLTGLPPANGDAAVDPVIDFGDAVILPGLVNAHTHLDLTHWAGKVEPDSDFVGWLERLRVAMHAADDIQRELADSADEGMRRSLALGVTTVGDITSRPAAVRRQLSHGPLRVVSFGEVIATGKNRGRLSRRLQAAVDGTYASDYLAIAVSPHAPYTIESDGIRACVESAGRLGLRMCMHLAESPAEARYTQRGDGPFRDFLERMGLWDEVTRCPRMAPVALAHVCGVLGPRTVLAHCNYVSDEDMRLIRASGAHVAYCPRTHAAFGHEPHRFGEMMAMGINVCVGTDSLASNPSLSVLDEIRFLRSMWADFDGHTLLEMATIRGARALGLADRIGTLTPGKSADITVVPLDSNGLSDPLENLLTSKLQPAATIVRGRKVQSRHA
ncbi:MAG: amidohydrolase family protein [Phycisphaerae bacterium]